MKQDAPGGVEMPVFDEFTDKDAALNNALTLAFIGDTVFERFVRELAVKRIPGARVRKLHKVCSAAVNAGAQAKILDSLTGSLSETELSIVKRGRNSKPKSIPKNQSIEDYLKATGFEALIGYLELSGDDARLLEILALCEPDVSAYIDAADR